jgi:uncharacterized membrane protein
MPGTPDTELVVLLNGMRQRFALIDRQLMELQADITGYTAAARRERVAATPQPERPTPQPTAAVTQPRPVQPRPANFAQAAPAARPSAPPRPGWFERLTAEAMAGIRRHRGELNLSDFLGLRALAWVGAVITLLGILFFYASTASGPLGQRGWVGPGGRVVLGAAISTGLLALASWLRHLRGQPEAALAAAGTGIAGLYVTLFAATKLYHYLPTAAGMPLALAIAGLAIVVALAWATQSLALLGLTGAALAPSLVEGGTSPAGVAFAGIALAAALLLWLERDWRVVVAVTSAVTVPQLVWLVAEQAGSAPAIGWNAHWQTVVVTAGFWVVYVVAGFARQIRSETGRLDRATLSLFASTSTSALAATTLLFTDGDRGWAMLVVAAVYGGITFAPAAIGRPQRDLSGLLAATALTAAMVATAELLGGGGRAVTLAAEAGLAAWLAHRFDERRLQHASLAYLTVAAGFTLAQAPIGNLIAFPPVRLLDSADHFDSGLALESVASAVALAVAVALFAAFSRPIGTGLRTWRRITGGSALIVGLYAAAQAVLNGFIWMHFSQRSFENGHTVVSLLVALVGVALLVIGLRRHSRDERTAGLILLAAAVAKLFLYDLVELNLMARAVAFIAVGLLLLAGGIVYQRLWDEELPGS